ncbi:MAG: tetratricopeptide repeat protein [Myxococcales bacterium]|nr:tetratricopeptide repeat protein [Myxococcales bacterium]
MTRRTALALSSLLFLGCPEQTGTPERPKGPERAASEKADAGPSKPKPEEISVTSSSPEAVTAFKRGRYLVENDRLPEGVEHLKKAVELDGQFPLALAYLGFFTESEEGNQMLERAASLSDKLPKAERLYVEHLLTWRQGDWPTLREQRKRLLQLAPNDWRVHYELGIAAQDDQNFELAEGEYRLAIELNPAAAAPYSRLGYSLMSQGKFDEAIAALQKYAAQYPEEPNAQDTLGEAQLRAGKLADAEATFAKAAAMGSGFWQAWIGAAASRFFQGNFDGGRQALSKAHEVAVRPEDKLEASHFLIWSRLCEKDSKAALLAVDALEKEAKAAKVAWRWAEAPIYRAAVLTESGKHAQVLSQLPLALDRARKTGLAGEPLARLYRLGFQWKIVAETRTGKLKDAEKSVAFLAKTAGVSPGRETQSTASFSAGLLSWAKGEKEAALQQLSECIEEDFVCRLELSRAKAKVGDSAGAGTVREGLLKAYRRDPVYLYVRTLAEAMRPGAAEPAGKK